MDLVILSRFGAIAAKEILANNKPLFEFVLVIKHYLQVFSTTKCLMGNRGK
jgi:hypothetical protein